MAKIRLLTIIRQSPHLIVRTLKIFKTPQKFFAIAAVTLLCFLTYASVSPLRARPNLSTSTDLEHFIAFAALGILFALAYPRQIAFRFLAVNGSAVLLELMQLATPDRHARYFDAFEKVAGGCTGLLAGSALLYLQQTLRRP